MLLDDTLSTIYSDKFNSMYRIQGKRKQNKNLFQQTTFWVHDVDLPVVTKTLSGTEQFKKDLIANKPIEDLFVNAYHCHNYNSGAVYELNDSKDFDLKITYVTTEGDTVYSYIELKNDTMAVRTGNVAIQFYAWGRDSGIRVTKASLWVQRVGGFFIVMNTHKLKELINNLKPETRWGGDSGKANNYIIPVNDLVSIAEAIIVDEVYPFK